MPLAKLRLNRKGSLPLRRSVASRGLCHSPLRGG